MAKINKFWIDDFGLAIFFAEKHGSFIWTVLLLVIQTVSVWANPLAAMY